MATAVHSHSQGDANMSNSWRRQGQTNRQGQDRASGTSTPTKDAGRQQPMPNAPANVWGAKGKPAGAAPATPAQQAQPEHHVPVRDFNANEVREFLKKSTFFARVCYELEIAVYSRVRSLGDLANIS